MVGALTIVLLTGCTGERAGTEPAITAPTWTRDSVRAGFALVPRLEITPANENRCESRVVERDAGDRFVGWRATVREQVAVTRGATDTMLTRYELYAFNPRGKQTGEAQCVLRRGAAAATFMRGFFDRSGSSTLVSVLAEPVATPVPAGGPPVSIGVGTVCALDAWTWQMQCGNTTCYPMFAARVPTRATRGALAGLVTDTATRAGGGTSPLIGGWECPGLGNLSLNGDGTLTFHPEGGGGSGGGDGSCGSGGAPAAVIRPVMGR